MATDVCDGAVACKIAAVSSNEAVDGGGDGSTAPDWVLPGGLVAQLRAERSGSGSGRIYTVTVACSDASMNVATGTVEMRAAHDRGK